MSSVLIIDALKSATKFLDAHGVRNSRLSAQLLLSDVLDLNRSQLYINPQRSLSHSQLKQFNDYVVQRSKNVPIQYILGHAYFYGLDFYVKKGVLIPRPETEVLVDLVIKHLRHVNLNKINIVDVCTGCGCIAISIAKNLCNTNIVATDISSTACYCAKKNVYKYHLESNIRLLNCDLCSGIKVSMPDFIGNIDLIVSNPPYIPTDDIEGLDAEVKNYEPLLALDGGHDGLKFFISILNFAKYALKPGGLLVFELHENCINKAVKIAYEMGCSNVKTFPDLAYKPRVLYARL